MKKSKLRRACTSIAAAFVSGTAKAIQTKSGPFAPEPLTAPVDRPNTQSMLSFAEGLLEKYGGRDAAGRTHIKEKLNVPLEDMAKQAKLDLENGARFAAGREERQIYARCPACQQQIFLGKVGAEDECGGCATWLRVMEGKTEPRTADGVFYPPVTFRYFTRATKPA